MTKVMGGVRATREPVVLTKKGRPVAKLVPVEAASPDVFGCLSGVVEIVGDIEKPVVPPGRWKALR